MARVKRPTTMPPGRLRIVAGKWRSRLLDIADVEGLRPTAERVRETLFNWLAPRINGARCLDLYAGTGALGLEALSRGAKSCVFVERSPVAVRRLRANAELLGAEQADVRETDANRFLSNSSDRTFDLVFLDPPFAADLLGETCRLLAEQGMLANGAQVYVEFGRGQEPPELPPGWRVTRDGSAGNVRYMLIETGA